MSVDPAVNLQTLLNNFSIIFKIGFILFSLLYFIFSLIVVRQVNLMTETVITEAAGIFKLLSLLHALLALGILILFIFLL